MLQQLTSVTILSPGKVINTDDPGSDPDLCAVCCWCGSRVYRGGIDVDVADSSDAGGSNQEFTPKGELKVGLVCYCS
jgi:hypothetical protein